MVRDAMDIIEMERFIKGELSEARKLFRQAVQGGNSDMCFYYQGRLDALVEIATKLFGPHDAWRIIHEANQQR